ncbi:hypothetical protein RB614_11535 [Phytohabitans sp. ZYX-F-186]|uniref:Secreted protein n=1 Tax=Phytohabitans maris TaxID=3071409 RepID=A0ABU0ZFI5_9ACTN|nr:hypothetical protein [Phytohabitans sp. ZYX-F-186]MDQ7905154.1 hypothetical protein [Phytohabitans sp. ZYX-F-186]
MRVRRGVVVSSVVAAVGATLVAATGVVMPAAGEFNSGVVVAQDCPPEKCGKVAPLQNRERW